MGNLCQNEPRMVEKRKMWPKKKLNFRLVQSKLLFVGLIALKKIALTLGTVHKSRDTGGILFQLTEILGKVHWKLEW